MLRPSRLKVVLDRFVETRPWVDRIKADPIEFPHRYRAREDIEVVGLVSTALAYGRVDLFKPKTDGLLMQLGPHPAQAVANLEVDGAKALLDGFVYRFNVASDLAVLLMGIGRVLARQGSLENAFLASRTSSWNERLSAFAQAIRHAAPETEIIKKMGPTRGLNHLLPSARVGAAKRLNLYLRWMVRGPDSIDFGIWSRVSPSELRIPLDTHVMRISRLLGFTKRQSMGWATVEEITGALRKLDAADPTRYDFALCHYGMSGACPIQPVASNCRKCPLKADCEVGRRVH